MNYLCGLVSGTLRVPLREFRSNRKELHLLVIKLAGQIRQHWVFRN
jgi:hypothetical protein